MNDIDVFEELAIDLMTVASLGKDDADRIVEFLQSEGLIDHDDLYEYYEDMIVDDEETEDE